jgi:cbb3-type cytochrome oxidase subunit 3
MEQVVCNRRKPNLYVCAWVRNYSGQFGYLWIFYYSLCFYLDVVSAFGAQTKEEINVELILLVFLLCGINATSYSVPVSLYLPAQI